MEFRVIPLQIRGLLELHEAARFTFCKQCNTGGTVVNQSLIIPQRFFKSLCGFLFISKVPRKEHFRRCSRCTEIHTCRKELPT